MPKLWNDTIEAHRTAVRSAVLDAVALLLFRDGPRAATMSKIAEEAGVGRATLYKYFPDFESVVAAWHERQVESHLQHLAEVGASCGDPARRLEMVLGAYAGIAHDRQNHPHDELVSSLHRGAHAARSRQRLRALMRDLIGEAAAAGAVRTDMLADELARFSIHALDAAAGARGKKEIRHLVMLVMAGLGVAA